MSASQFLEFVRTIRGRHAFSINTCEEDASRVLSIWLLRRICPGKNVQNRITVPDFGHKIIVRFNCESIQKIISNIGGYQLPAWSTTSVILQGKEASAIILLPCLHSNYRVTSSLPTTTIFIVFAGKDLLTSLTGHSYVCGRWAVFGFEHINLEDKAWNVDPTVNNNFQESREYERTPTEHHE